jgi:acetyl-CoA acetyltransferase
MSEAYIVSAVRTPIGRAGGALATVRADDLAAVVVRAAVQRAQVDPSAIDGVIACVRTLDLEPAKVNVHGGAIALGHPPGSSGARMLVTLVHALGRRGGRCGLATMCIGVGQGIAVVVESLQGR